MSTNQNSFIIAAIGIAAGLAIYMIGKLVDRKGLRESLKDLAWATTYFFIGVACLAQIKEGIFLPLAGFITFAKQTFDRLQTAWISLEEWKSSTSQR